MKFNKSNTILRKKPFINKSPMKINVNEIITTDEENKDELNSPLTDHENNNSLEKNNENKDVILIKSDSNLKNKGIFYTINKANITRQTRDSMVYI